MRRDRENKDRENRLDTERRNAEFQRRQESERARLAAQQEQSAQQERETVRRREAVQQREADDRRRASQDQLEKSRYEAQLKATNRNTLVTGLGAAAVVYSIYDTARARQTPPPLPDGTLFSLTPPPLPAAYVENENERDLANLKMFNNVIAQAVNGNPVILRELQQSWKEDHNGASLTILDILRGKEEMLERMLKAARYQREEMQRIEIATGRQF